MKLLIFEGLDNIGKSTLITWVNSALQTQRGIDGNRINIIHFTQPQGVTNAEMIKNIDNYNNTICNDIVTWQNDNIYDYVILDRSWYSEYVYGQIYRNRLKRDILHKIKLIELTLMWHMEIEDIYYIYVNTADLDFVIDNEDGESLSNSKNKANMLKTIKKEQKLFNEIYKDYSLLPKSCKHTIDPITNHKFNDVLNMASNIVKKIN